MLGSVQRSILSLFCHAVFTNLCIYVHPSATTLRVLEILIRNDWAIIDFRLHPLSGLGFACSFPVHVMWQHVFFLIFFQGSNAESSRSCHNAAYSSALESISSRQMACTEVQVIIPSYPCSVNLMLETLFIMCFVWAVIFQLLLDLPF